MEEKYIELLNLRIEENRKIENKMLLIMVFSILAFPMLKEAKIGEVSIGPFKINDLEMVWASIPTIYAYCYYKYVVVYADLKSQIAMYKKMTSKIFVFEKEDNYFNSLLIPFSFLEKITSNHSDYKSKIEVFIFGVLIYIPVLLILLLVQVFFILYCVFVLIDELSFLSKIDYIFVITPIILFVSMIVYTIKNFKKEYRRLKNDQTN